MPKGTKQQQKDKRGLTGSTFKLFYISQNSFSVAKGLHPNQQEFAVRKLEKPFAIYRARDEQNLVLPHLYRRKPIAYVPQTPHLWTCDVGYTHTFLDDL